MPSPRFTLRQLEIFDAVVRTGQVKRAAEALYLSQAAVSQALRELADALDVTLFARRGREIVPTASARQLLKLVDAPMASLAQIPLQLSPAAQTAGLTGDIRIAASSTITRYMLPPALGALRAAHPALTVRLISDNSAEVEAHIASLKADVGFIEGPPQRDDLAVEPWGTDRLQIIAPPDYPVDSVQIDALDAHPWVAREAGSGTRAVFEQTLALAGHTSPRAALVLDDMGAIVRAVAAGGGLACVSQNAVKANALVKLQTVNLPGLSLQRPLWRIQRKSATQSAMIAHFLATLDDMMDVNSGPFRNI